MKNEEVAVIGPDAKHVYIVRINAQGMCKCNSLKELREFMRWLVRPGISGMMKYRCEVNGTRLDLSESSIRRIIKEHKDTHGVHKCET